MRLACLISLTLAACWSSSAPAPTNKKTTTDGKPHPVANGPDADKDGIADDVDKCPTAAEDFDGFEDEDGCPEPDNDRDGVLDARDRCPNIPSRTPDGCPARTGNDRDGDGLLDSVDRCPDDPEDFDGFQDQDGCPDIDNDGDGVKDVDDLCPNQPEDKDGFEDADGCPDPDNDKDGVLDAQDKCPNQPGPAANGGCP